MAVLEDPHSTPYAAPTDSRLSTIALAGMTIERNVTSSSRNASDEHEHEDQGARDFISSLKSKEPAVSPVTGASAPGSRPSGPGMTSSRSVCSARLEVSSVPVPAIGTLTWATLRSRLLTTVTGSRMSPVATARLRSSRIAAVTCSVVTSGALSAMTAASGSPGNAF